MIHDLSHIRIRAVTSTPPAAAEAPLADATPVPPAATAEQFRPFALAAVTVALVALCVVVAVPLLPTLTWGVAFAVIAWPVHHRIARRTGRPALAALVTTAVVAGVITAGLALVAVQLARETVRVADENRGKPPGDAVREAATSVPGGTGVVGWLDRVGVDLDRQVRAIIEPYTRDGAGLAEGSLQAVVHFVLAMFVMFFLLKDRAELLEAGRHLLPMTRAEADRVFARFADSVYGNLYADLVTSLIDATLGGVLFWLVGMPSPVLWATVMFVLSLLPLFGAWMVWLPAAGYLAIAGNWVGAAVLAVTGAAAWLLVDNWLYVRIAGDRMRLHEVPALVAFVGGLAVFGASGMVLGPAIVAVTVAVIDVWRRRRAAKTDSVAVGR